MGIQSEWLSEGAPRNLSDVDILSYRRGSAEQIFNKIVVQFIKKGVENVM